MNLTEFKKEAEKFRKYVKAFDKAQIATDADALVKANPTCPDCADLADSLKGAGNGTDVATILDEVANRK